MQTATTKNGRPRIHEHHYPAMIADRKAGKNYVEIAKKYKCHHSTVIKVVKEHDHKTIAGAPHVTTHHMGRQPYRVGRFGLVYRWDGEEWVRSTVDLNQLVRNES